MSGHIPPMVSSSPPPLDDNLDDEEEDEFGDFTAADLSYGIEGEVMVAPKGGELQVPTAEPRLCNGDNTSQDSVVSGATDSGLCSASEEGGERERDAMVAGGEQMTVQEVGTCDVERVPSPCSSPDITIHLSHPADVGFSNEGGIQSKDWSEGPDNLSACVSNTPDDTLDPSSRVQLSESSCVVSVEICERDTHDAKILSVSEQTVNPSVSLGNGDLRGTENDVNTCQLEDIDNGDCRSSGNSTVGRQIDNVHDSDEFGSFTEFSNVEENTSLATVSRTNAFQSFSLESIGNDSVPQNEDCTVEECVKSFNSENTCEVPVVDFKSGSITEQPHEESDSLRNVPEVKEDEAWDDFSSFTSASKSGDGALEDEFADFSSAAPTEKQKVNSSDWADVSLQQTAVVTSAGTSAADDDFEDFESIACVKTVSQNYDLLLSRLEGTIADLFPAAGDGASCPADCAALVRSRVWEQLRDLETSHALLYQWSGSAGNKLLLSALGVDARNILFGPRWNVSVPRFAANLGLSPLEPVRANSTAGGSSPVTPQASDSKAEGQDVPAVQFDWNDSGLVNPLDSPRPTKTDSARQRSNPLVLSAEALSVLENLPDLSFLRAHLLMFPVHSGDGPGSPDGF